MVGRAGLAHPKADLERPAAEPGGGILAALQFKGADQPGRAPELIEGQQPQGVAHDDADPGPGESGVSLVAEPPKDHGERGEAEVRLGLAAAGREEEEVHELALGIGRVRDAGEVQEDEGELKGPPAGRRPGYAFAGEAARESRGHGTIRGAEGVERARVIHEEADPALHPVRGDRRKEQEFLGRRQAIAGQPAEPAPPAFDPRPILRHERGQRPLGCGAVGECAEHPHVELRPRHIEGLRLLHVGGGGPGGSEHVAGTVHQLPVGGDAVAGRVLRGVGVVQIRDTLVQVAVRGFARVRARDERDRAPHLDLGLERKRLVPLLVGRRSAAVHQKQGNGAGSGWDPSREVRGIHRAGDHVEGKAAGVSDRFRARASRNGGQRNRYRYLARSSLPPGPHAARAAFGLVGGHPAVRATLSAALVAALARALAPLAASRLGFAGFRAGLPTRTAAFRFNPAVVAPADDDLQRVEIRADQEAESHGRGEEALLRRPPVLRRVVPEPCRLRDLGLFVHVRVAALLDRRPTGNQKPGEIPVGRPHPARKSLIRQRMPGPRSNQVEPERPDDLLANLGGFRQTSHVTSRPAPASCIDALNETRSGEATENSQIGGPSWLCPPARLCSSEKMMSDSLQAEQEL